MSKPQLKAPPKPHTMLLSLLLSSGFGGVVGFLVGHSAMKAEWIGERLHVLAAWDLLILPILILLALALHEAGHLLGGLTRGMRFLLFIVGPFKLSRTPSGIRFDWVFNLGTFGGMAAATPNPDQPMLPQLKRLIVGGPLASLIVAVIGIATGMAFEGRLGTYSLFVGAISVLIFVVTAVPFRASGFMSDGMQMLELLRGGRCVEERQVLTILVSQSLAGVRPRDLDPEAIAKALNFESAEPLRQIATRLLAYLAAVDRHDIEASDAHASWLAEHVNQYPQGFRQSITIELCLHAALRADQDRARAWMALSKGGVVDAARRALAEATLATLESNHTKAANALARARRLEKNAMDPGLGFLTRDQIEACAAQLQSSS